jgi:hypothetical protein
VDFQSKMSPDPARVVEAEGYSGHETRVTPRTTILRWRAGRRALPFRVPMQQHAVTVKFCNYAADALDLLLVTGRTQQFSVVLDLLIYFNARLAHAIRPSAPSGPIGQLIVVIGEPKHDRTDFSASPYRRERYASLSHRRQTNARSR